MVYSKEIFFKDASISVSVIRIGIALSYLFTFINYPILSDINTLSNYSYYDPKGLLSLIYPTHPPSEIIWKILVVITITLSFLYLIGFLTRIISVVLLVFVFILFGLHESLNKLGYWSHGLVIMPITHLAFIFAPAGKISLDYFIHSKIKRFKSFFYQDKNYFFYTVFPLVMLTLMFFNAFCWKVYNSGFYWAFSDNMRNILILQYTMVQNIEMPWYISIILGNEYYYKGLAFLNLLFQFTPILAVFFLNRPKIKLLLGVFFLLEIFGLYFVVKINAMQWIPLFVIFIDWDYFFNSKFITLDLYNKLKVRAILTYLFSYLLFSIWICFDFKDIYKAYKLNCFPVSPFPMYSENVAKKPYNKHLSFERPGLIFEIVLNDKSKSQIEVKGIENRLIKNFSDNYRGIHTYEGKLKVLKEINNYLISSNISFKKLYIYYGYNSVEPYPSNPFPKPINKGLYGVLFSNGEFEFLSINRQLDSDNKFYLTIKNHINKDSIEHIEYVYEMSGKPTILKSKIKNDTIFYNLPENGYYSFLLYLRSNNNENDINKRRYHSEIFGHWFN